MKKTLLSVALALTTMSVYAQPPLTFSTTGIATILPGTVKGGSDTVNVTPCSGGTYASGAAWMSKNVDFTKCFTIKFKAMFDVVYGTGGDGICVVFGSNITSSTLPNGIGGYLGYYNPPSVTDPDFSTHSMAIEMDNFNDCPYASLHDCPSTLTDHTHFSKDANAAPLTATTTASFPASSGNNYYSAAGGSIKDGAFHDYEVQWVPLSAGGPRLTFVKDGAVIEVNTHHWAPHFTTPNSVPWGFTGGCAVACSHQEITDVVLSDSCACGCGCGSGGEHCSDKCYWRLTGNNISPTDFIGTLNKEDFKIRTDNTQWAIIDMIGRSGIHIPAPSTTLDVEGKPVPAYGTLSGIRFRNLPKGPGRPLVVDAFGYVYESDIKVPGATTDGSTDDIAELKAEIGELRQQMSALKSMYNAGPTNPTMGNSMTVMPNPSSGDVTVRYAISSIYGNAMISVTDITGKSILTYPIASSSGEVGLNIPANVASGQLIVSLMVDGQVSISEKLVLQR